MDCSGLPNLKFKVSKLNERSVKSFFSGPTKFRLMVFVDKSPTNENNFHINIAFISTIGR